MDTMESCLSALQIWLLRYCVFLYCVFLYCVFLYCALALLLCWLMVLWRYCSVALRSSCPGPYCSLVQGPIALLLDCPITHITLLPCCPPALDYSVLSCSDSNPPLWPLLSNPTSDLLFVFMDASLIGCLSRSRSWSPRARSLAISHPIHPLAHLLLLRQPTNPSTPPPLHPPTTVFPFSPPPGSRSLVDAANAPHSPT
jgi:hypothetical protein